MEIAQDTFVVIEYSLRPEDGSFLRGEGEPASLNFVVGYDQLLPALEHRLLGLAVGAEVDFTIPAREAFGEHDPQQVRTKSFDDFPEGQKLIAGKWGVATNALTQAQYGYFVKEKTDSGVVLDFNHPLAGKDLYYHVKVVHVRAASKDELEYLRPCQQGTDDAQSN